MIGRLERKMQTDWVHIDEKEIGNDTSKEAIERAGAVIRSGGLVAFPTETVYGLGGDALNAEASRKIYEAKGRPSDNPLIVHIADFSDLYRIAGYVPESAELLAQHFWPGPLTMILEKSGTVPSATTGGLSTVAVRFPNHPLALSFIRASGGYIAAPSANASGRPSPTEGRHVYEDLGGRIDMILDGGSVGIGLESTIVDLTADTPMILRPGYITEEMLLAVLGEVRSDKTMFDVSGGVRPKAPGMKYKHYAPKGELSIVSGDSEKVIQYINDNIAVKKKEGRRVGVIGTSETIGRYIPCVRKNIGSRNDEAEIARNLYEILREFDEENVEYMYTEAFGTGGMGQAIMNRLLKAAGHRVIEV